MALTCEVCGNPLRGPPTKVEIDGAILRVCASCARRGNPIGPPSRPPRGPSVRLPGEKGLTAELEVDPDYSSIVKQGREKLGLTHEQLGRLINVKPSVISHVETGKMKPDLVLARTLMHHLKVNLLVSSRDLDSNAG